MAGWTTADMPRQDGRIALVTGANSGLGLRSAEALAAAGAAVLLGCRNAQRGAAALDQVKAAATGAAPRVVDVDLADLDSVRTAAAALAGEVETIDILVNNAGVMAIPLRRTPQGFEAQFGTNHLGHFALTGLLLPLLLSASAPRVVTVTSQMHRMARMRWDDLNSERRYQKWAAYVQSKLANLLFTAELDRRARSAGTALVAMAAHPGYAATNLQTAGANMAGKRVMERVTGVFTRLFAQSDAMGALPQLYAATAPEVEAGALYGPDRLFETRGHPKRTTPARTARDTSAAARLWDISEQLTGVRYAWPAAPAEPSEPTEPT